MWNVGQYERYQDERARPFLDLVARVPDRPVATAVDLGCGTGELTRLLLDRWPEARIIGVDSSADMLRAGRAIPGHLDLVQADVSTWLPPAPLDLVLSNATLHWLPDHERLLSHLAAMVAPGGVMAVQAPDNFAAPSHEILLALAREPPFAGPLAAWHQNAVMPLEWYVTKLWSLGFEVDAWTTTYLHVLQGDDPVLEWVKGTTLRPVLALLDEPTCAAFLTEYGARLRVAYPRGARGTIFPFRRLFFVARRQVTP